MAGAGATAETRRQANPFFLAAKYGGFNDLSGVGHPFLDARGGLDNSSWERPGDAGEASNYFRSNNTRAALQAISTVFESATRQTYQVAGAATTDGKVGAGATVFQASFDPGAWSGDLQARNIVQTPQVALAASPTWSAAQRLDLVDVSRRNIVIGKVHPGALDNATPFIWADLDAELKAALDKPDPSAASDGLGPSRVNYLRGNRRLETGVSHATFRRRNSRLGDIVNSAVVYSGAPTGKLASPTYASFYAAHKTRSPAVFVGANDGMLHGFDAATGDELLAYIPSWLGPKLSALTTSAFQTRHQNYVDASPAVADAEVSGAWKTVLVGGTGGGGQGVYALDVTEPSTFSAADVLWEFTDRDDAALGHVIGQPQIRKFRVNAPTAVRPVYKWFAVIAGGVNNHAPDGFASATGAPALFFLDLSKSRGSAWSEGVNYFKVVLPLNGGASALAGLANFEVALGLQGEAKYLYAGDLQGRLWKLDFSKSVPSIVNWTADKLSYYKTADSLKALPMFVARDDSGAAQPITAAPFIANGPGGTSVVVFGTGKYLEPKDRIVDARQGQVQSVYALNDDNLADLDDTHGVAAISGRSRLRLRPPVSAEDTGPAVAPASPMSEADSASLAGWYFDLPTAGERLVQPVMTVGQTLIFSSLIPPGASPATGARAGAAGNRCDGGSGQQYVIDLLTGTGTSAPSSLGQPGPTLVFDLGDSEPAVTNSTGRRLVTRTRQLVSTGSDGLAVGTTVKTKVSLGRLSWRQVSNYQEVRGSP